MLAEALHVVSVLDPLDDSDEEGDDGSRHSYRECFPRNGVICLPTLCIDVRIRVLESLDRPPFCSPRRRLPTQALAILY